jgi:ABC-2 type transport system permease protein
VIVWAALRKELLEQWRSYRLLIVVVVLLLFGLTSPLLAKYTPELLRLAIPEDQALGLLSLIPPPTAADAVGQYVKNLTQFGILLALLMAMGTVAQEKDKGTAALILAKPLPRGVFILAKFAALGLTFALGVILAGAAGYLYTVLLFGAIPLPAWIALNALLLVVFLVYLALTVLCSTLTRSQVVAAGLAFGTLVVVLLLSSLPRVGDYMPNRLIAWGTGLFTGTGGAPWAALWVSFGLIAASLLAAWLAFRRQEL